MHSALVQVNAVTVRCFNCRICSGFECYLLTKGDSSTEYYRQWNINNKHISFHHTCQKSRFVSRVGIQAPVLRCRSLSVECKELLSGIQCYSDKVCSDPCSYNLILHPLACGRGWERISDKNRDAPTPRPPTLNILNTMSTFWL